MPPRPPLPLLSNNSLVYLWRGVIGGAAAGEMMEAPARHLQSHLVRIKSLDCAWVVVGCSDMCALAAANPTVFVQHLCGNKEYAEKNGNIVESAVILLQYPFK